MSPFLCLLLPVVYGQLIIDIDLLDHDIPLLDARGKRTAVITERERKTFQITDESLKKTIAKATNGSEPTDVYVKKTGLGFDLHKTYSWEEVKRTVKTTFNVTKAVCRHDAEMLDKYEMSVKSAWTSKGNVSVDLEYVVYLNGKEEMPRILTAFGEDIDKSKGYTKSEKVHVKNCVFTIDVSFKVDLKGRIAANYLPVRKDHHFWSYDVNYVLQGAKLPTEVVFNETIVISYYKVQP